MAASGRGSLGLGCGRRGGGRGRGSGRARPRCRKAFGRRGRLPIRGTRRGGRRRGGVRRGAGGLGVSGAVAQEGGVFEIVGHVSPVLKSSAMSHPWRRVGRARVSGWGRAVRPSVAAGARARPRRRAVRSPPTARRRRPAGGLRFGPAELTGRPPRAEEAAAQPQVVDEAADREACGPAAEGVRGDQVGGAAAAPADEVDDDHHADAAEEGGDAHDGEPEGGPLGAVAAAPRRGVVQVLAAAPAVGVRALAGGPATRAEHGR